MGLLFVSVPSTIGYENEVLRAEVSQVQVYKDRIDEMDSMTLKMAQLEKTNTRYRPLLPPHWHTLREYSAHSHAVVEVVVQYCHV